MESGRLSGFGNFASSGQNPLPPKRPLQSMFLSNADHFPRCKDSSHEFSEPSGGEAHHHRASSDSFLIEQPSWLEELLDEPESPPLRAPRRSASYSTFLDVVADSIKEDINVVQISRSSIRTSNPRKAGGTAQSKAIVKHNQQEHECSGKPNGSNANLSSSKADVKRAKQQYAQRSRLRKLQHIAELERNVKILQAEGSQVSAALEYLDQQVLILGMENQALRQRLEGLSHEQQIKLLEKDMLERELARLHFLYHQQQQPQERKQQQPQKQTHSSQKVQSKGRELELQMASLSI